MNKKSVYKIPIEQKDYKKTVAIVLIIMAALLFSVIYLEISVLEMLMGLPQFVMFFFEKFLPANSDNLKQYIPSVIDTLGYAIIATYFSTILAFIFGILISENTNKFKTLRVLTRGFVSVLRNIPFIIWGSLLVYIFGLGGIVGVLALILVTIGFLSKSYAESIDEISGDKLEALRANGASYFQILFHGVIPQFVPAWINWTLFSFEINVRASVVLGLVGAGGIGVLIDTNINLFKYGEALTIIAVVVSIILLTEFITNSIRKRFI
ncbi:phosphonate ABC transporter, permease protein PhnE [Metabacillus niabensis]|uniref:Phosphonate transport system permease protein n=1 Tax=Metabacillus niabensis TaxID=324854 RepID=A0ABT9Z3F7_9BACI|nr:phosphonate ABC transporter, permease protein PhnE [Metabacillus niabensis]MDQ0226545.1 phosphonate transport system permease protein [Metabacillus niabensis]